MKTRANGIEIDYRDGGSGVPVILIHAFPLNQTMWDDQFSPLQRHCRAITLDLRGFGGSEQPHGPCMVEDMAADVRGLMLSLGLDQAVLVGLSMGGYVSLAFYRNYPEAVRALVLADTRASADTQEGRERRLKSAEKAERAGASAIADDMLPLLLGRTSLETRPDIVKRVRSIIEMNSPNGIACAQRAMAGRRDSTDLLPSIDVPVLIIVGSEDRLTSVTEAETLSSGIRGARLEVIAGGGHLSNIEQPEEFRAVLTAFITSVEGERGG
ncbi:MAG TPA: alpha/beta hydrolase [Blastocatellia bacterium]|nr:alpha/beta hydrolase [Blastocatellia bacterium]